MGNPNEGMLAFLGVPADRRLLDEDLVSLPAAEQYHEPAVVTHKHDRLVAAGSLVTGATLIGGAAIAIYGGWEVLFNDGGALGVVAALIGILLVATHWGWVHVAEYLGVAIDERARRSQDARRQDWLAAIQPYPRFSVSTVVLDDASTRIERVLHQSVNVPGLHGTKNKGSVARSALGVSEPRTMRALPRRPPRRRRPGVRAGVVRSCGPGASPPPRRGRRSRRRCAR